MIAGRYTEWRKRSRQRLHGDPARRPTGTGLAASRKTLFRDKGLGLSARSAPRSAIFTQNLQIISFYQYTLTL